MIVAFYDNSLNIRGTSVALFDYAYYNEKILNNKSIIIHLRNNDTNESSVIEKFKNLFNVYGVSSIHELDTVIKKENCDVLYVIKYGYNDNIVSKICKTVVHCVFDTSYPHGDVHASISGSIINNNNQSVSYCLTYDKYTRN